MMDQTTRTDIKHCIRTDRMTCIDMTYEMYNIYLMDFDSPFFNLLYSANRHCIQSRCLHPPRNCHRNISVGSDFSCRKQARAMSLASIRQKNASATG